MKDVMIDLETFGNGKNACVVQIGACYFDRATGEIGETIKLNIDARTGTGDINPDTVYWWLSQSKEAIQSILEPGMPETVAFNLINNFLSEAKYIWSHATFDFVILTETLRRLKIKPSFRYSAARDIRTLVDLAKINTKSQEFKREGTHHDGLDDAKFQVKYCVAALNNLK